MKLRSSSIVCAFFGAALVVACGGGNAATAPANASDSATSAKASSGSAPIYDFDVKTIDGEPVKLDRYRGKVLLVVNVASKCGFTPQYEALEALYQKHAKEGFEILGFPCDQFGHQEPGTEAEIKTFCTTRYAVHFPLFSKIEVNGPKADPLYQYMRAQQPGSLTKDTPGAEMLYGHLEKNFPELLGTDAVKWNFTKFLVDRSGKVVHRFESPEKPEAIEPQVAALLAAH